MLGRGGVPEIGFNRYQKLLFFELDYKHFSLQCMQRPHLLESIMFFMYKKIKTKEIKPLSMYETTSKSSRHLASFAFGGVNRQRKEFLVCL